MSFLIGIGLFFLGSTIGIIVGAWWASRGRDDYLPFGESLIHVRKDRS